jgi:hypothetical protein
MIGDIINYLTAYVPITAHVGPRIFPVHIDQDATLPAIMITINDVETNPTKNAVSSDDFVELDITIYSKTALEAFTIAELVRARLDNFSGTMGTTNLQSLRFESLNLNHFAGDDLFICGSEYLAHVRR